MRKSNEEDLEHLVRMRKSVVAYVKKREILGYQVNSILKNYVAKLEKNPEVSYYLPNEEQLDVR